MKEFNEYIAVEVVFVDKSLTAISSRSARAREVENVGSYQYLKDVQIKACPEAVTRASKLNLGSFWHPTNIMVTVGDRWQQFRLGFLPINKSSYD